jgi:hypothetical protein
MPPFPSVGLGPLSPSTATRLCAGAMQNACRWYGDLPPWGAPETAMLLPRIASRRIVQYCQALEPHTACGFAPSRDRLDGLEPLTSAFGSVEIGPMLDKGPRGACQRMRPVGRDPVVLSWCCQLVLRIRLRRRAAWTRTALIMPKHGFKADAAVGDEADPGNLCRAAHNPEVAGSNPARYQGQRPLPITGGPFSMPNANLLAGRGSGAERASHPGFALGHLAQVNWR